MTKLQMAQKLKSQDMQKPKNQQCFPFGSYTMIEVYTKADLVELYNKYIKEA